MNKINLTIILILLTTFFNFTFGQSIRTDSIEFCGRHFIAPNSCEIIGNMIKCSNYVFTWTYAPTTDLPRHRKELLAQTKSPKKIKVVIDNNDIDGYLSKTGTYSQLLIIGVVNGQGVIINLWLDKQIKSTDDLPEYVKQLISIRS